MKKIIIVALLLGVISFFGNFKNHVEATQLENVTICHATGSESNPFVKILVDSSAISGHFENNGTPKSGHEDDLLFEGDVECPDGENGGGGGGSGGGGGGGGCTEIEIAPTDFAVDSGTPNDNTLELTWNKVPGADQVEIRYGHEDGVWLYTVTTEDDGQYSLGGLVNGVHYWLQIRAFNLCSDGIWSESVDPLP